MRFFVLWVHDIVCLPGVIMSSFNILRWPFKVMANHHYLMYSALQIRSTFWISWSTIRVSSSSETTCTWSRYWGVWLLPFKSWGLCQKKIHLQICLIKPCFISYNFNLDRSLDLLNIYWRHYQYCGCCLVATICLHLYVHYYKHCHIGSNAICAICALWHLLELALLAVPSKTSWIQYFWHPWWWVCILNILSSIHQVLISTSVLK